MSYASTYRSMKAVAYTIAALIVIGGVATYAQSAAAAVSPLGSVQIQVVVVGGTANASQFPLKIKKNGPVDTGTITGSGNTVTFSSLTPGTYTITSTGPSGYRGTWAGDCNSRGEVTIGMGDTAACTLTQTYGTTAGGGGGGGGGGETPTPGRGSGRSDRSTRSR